MVETNQCDGCRRGLPIKNGIHQGDSLIDIMACTADLYKSPTVKYPDPIEPIFFAKDIPKEWERIYAPFEPDWRPVQMRGLPRILTEAACGCHLHNGANYQEWIFCPTHALAPSLVEAITKDGHCRLCDNRWPKHLGQKGEGYHREDCLISKLEKQLGRNHG